MKKNITLFCFAILFINFLNSCSSKYIKLVSAETKTEFGFTIIAPSQCIFFVENTKVNATSSQIENHTKIANSIYNKFGPSSDKLFVGRTNARQLKFSITDKTYFIDITQLKKRTAMVIFDGKNKPIIEYNVEKYNNLVKYMTKS
ncbi:hypothetical protein, partial [Flavobacterium branchiophilum]